MNQEDPGRLVGQAKQKTKKKRKEKKWNGVWKETETMLSPSCCFEGATENKNDIRNTAVR
jgi:hypothetical protein